MKNIKAICLIVLGSFLLATGFAFAGSAYETLKNDPFADGRSASVTPSYTNAVDVMAVPPVVKPPEEVKKPTTGEKVKKYVKANFSNIVSAIAIGFIAFLVIGSGGAALGVGALAFGFFRLMASL